jgi:hypothetical protein
LKPNRYCSVFSLQKYAIFILKKMKISLLIAVFVVCLCSLSHGQLLVGHSKGWVKSELKYDFKSSKTIINETDSTYTVLLRDTSKKPMNIYCLFNKKGDCISQKMEFTCDSCYNIFLKWTLAVKRYQWKSIPNNRYVSKYSKHMLVIINDADHYYTVLYQPWTEDDYKKQLSTAVN